MLFSSAVNKKPMIVTTKNGIFGPRRSQISYIDVTVWRQALRFFINVHEMQHFAVFECREQKTYDRDHEKWNPWTKEVSNLISRCPSLEADA